MLNIIFTLLQICIFALILLNWILVSNSLINAIVLICGLVGLYGLEKIKNP